LGYVPLEPTAFLRRSARVFGDRIALVDDDATFTYAEFAERVDRIAGALRNLGVHPGDRVAVLAPNTHVVLALHYAVPLAGAVIVALNTRLSAGELAVIVEHSGAELLIHDYELEAVSLELIRLAGRSIRGVRCGDPASEFEADETMLVAYAREHIARFKAPKRIVFGELPKTGTGKIQKFALRDRAKALMTATK
jgi:fatty-acyl-CoA synthase